jgi:hypothetical protein
MVAEDLERLKDMRAFSFDPIKYLQLTGTQEKDDTSKYLV